MATHALGSFSPPTPPGQAPKPFEVVPDERPPRDATATWTGLVALIAAFAEVVLFFSAFGALNQTVAQRAEAWTFALAGVVVGAVGIGLAVYAGVRRRAPTAWTAAAGLLGLALGVLFASEISGSFGPFGGFGWFIMELILLGFLLAPFILFLVFAFGQRRRHGWGLGLGVLILHAGAWLVPLGFLLLNLERFAAEAEQANAPAAGPLVTLVAVALALLMRRRRHG